MILVGGASSSRGMAHPLLGVVAVGDNVEGL